MPHNTPLIGTIVGGIVFAFIFGALANRLRMPPLVGYLIAGVVMGPYTPGFVGDKDLAHELSEIGVILLMFGVGLHFSVKDLMSVKNIALPGAVVQIGIATLLGLGVGWLLDWPIGEGFLYGLALSTASTVVLLTALQERRLLETQRGRIAIGWLIVEDIAMVLALVLIPALSGLLGGKGEIAEGSELATTIMITLGKVVAFVAVMMIVGRRVIPWALDRVAATGSRELFSLCVLAIALGFALGAAYIFDVSFALGAFFAGMILAESELSHRAAEESLPLRDAFSVLFFVSVGMLLDPNTLVDNFPMVLVTLLIIMIGKSIGAFMIVRAFRYSTSTALTVSASLAQIGEFAFIIASLAMTYGLMTKETQDLVLAGAILSIVLNPVMFMVVDRIGKRLESKEVKKIEETYTEGEASKVPLENHTIVVGCGRIGARLVQHLKESGEPFVVIEDTIEEVDRLRTDGCFALNGNAAAPGILEEANVEKARLLLVAIHGSFEAGQLVDRARELNPDIKIVAHARSEAEYSHLKRHGVVEAMMGENEIAQGMMARAAALLPKA